MKDKIEDTLLSLGVPPQLRGFAYIADAVDIGISNPSSLYQITKVLYPDVAKRNGTTPTRVERAIRNAIDSTYMGAKNSERLRTKLGDVAALSERPTNSAFISVLCKKLSRNADSLSDQECVS